MDSWLLAIATKPGHLNQESYRGALGAHKMEGSWQSWLGKEIELRAAGVTAVILCPTAGEGWSFAVTAAAMSDFLKLPRTYFQSWERVSIWLSLGHTAQWQGARGPGSEVSREESTSAPCEHLRGVVRGCFRKERLKAGSLKRRIFTSKAISEFMGRKNHEGWDPETTRRVSFSLFPPLSPIISFSLTAELSPLLPAWSSFWGSILFIWAPATHRS